MSDYVTKAEAWDALAQIPPKAAKELEQLRSVADTARNVALFCGWHVPKDAVTVEVPVAYINELRAIFGMDEY
jgi:hypothetical protein